MKRSISCYDCEFCSEHFEDGFTSYYCECSGEPELIGGDYGVEYPPDDCPFVVKPTEEELIEEQAKKVEICESLYKRAEKEYFEQNRKLVKMLADKTRKIKTRNRN